MGGGTNGATARKLVGAFYTPDSTASSLARWAIRTGAESILEPSVGGGALLKAAITRARELRPLARDNQPFACDIDCSAVDRLRSEFGESVEFHAGDFLELEPRWTHCFHSAEISAFYSLWRSISKAHVRLFLRCKSLRIS